VNCERARKLVALYKPERLPRRLREELEAHLAECAACAEFARNQRLLDEVLPEALSEQAPAGFEFKVMERLEHTHLKRSGLNYLLLAVCALALFAVMFWSASQPWFVPDAPQMVDLPSALVTTYDTITTQLGSSMVALGNQSTFQLPVGFQVDSSRSQLLYWVVPTLLLLLLGLALAQEARQKLTGRGLVGEGNLERRIQ